MNILPLPMPKFVIKMAAPAAELTVGVPTVRDFYRCLTDTDKVRTADDILFRYGDENVNYPFSKVTAAEFLKVYADAILGYRDENLDIMKVPATIDFGGDKKPPFPVITSGRDMVYQYSGIDFHEQCDLAITEYWVLLADAIKTECAKTAKGREFLENAYVDMHRISTLEGNL